MKTGREFLETLPPNIRLAWAKEVMRFNSRRYLEHLLNSEKQSLFDLVCGSFLLHQTKQGSDFWYKISQS
jgi:hypothetical protein